MKKLVLSRMDPILREKGFFFCHCSINKLVRALGPLQNCFGLIYVGFPFAAIENYLLFASEHNVRGIPLDADVTSYVTDAMTPIVGVDSTFVAVDFDAEEDYIYYSDVMKDVIARIKTDGTGTPLTRAQFDRFPLLCYFSTWCRITWKPQECSLLLIDKKKRFVRLNNFPFTHNLGKELVVTNRLRSVEGIALDWVAKNLFFTDGSYGTLSVVRLGSPGFGDRRELLRDLGNPRAIVTHPSFGWVFPRACVSVCIVCVCVCVRQGASCYQSVTF